MKRQELKEVIKECIKQVITEMLTGSSDVSSNTSVKQSLNVRPKQKQRKSVKGHNIYDKINNMVNFKVD